MRSPLVHGQRGGLSVVLSAVITHVWLGVRVDHMVFVERRVLGKSLTAPFNCADIRLFTWRRGKGGLLEKGGDFFFF